MSFLIEFFIADHLSYSSVFMVRIEVNSVRLSNAYEWHMVVVSGKGDYELTNFPVEKVTLNEKKELECVHFIGENLGAHLFPILYHTTKDRCIA